VVTDRLTLSRLKFIDRARVHGAVTALDFGRPNYLRYWSAAELMRLFERFDLVVVQRTAAEELAHRGGLRSVAELARYGPRLGLIVSAGSDGMQLYRQGGGDGGERVPAPVLNDVVDDMGAGDAFLGRLLASILRAADGAGGLWWQRVDLLASINEAVGYTRDVLMSFGARGHLDRALPDGYPTQRWVGRTLDSIRSSVAGRDRYHPCVFCGGS